MFKDKAVNDRYQAMVGIKSQTKQTSQDLGKYSTAELVAIYNALPAVQLRKMQAID